MKGPSEAVSPLSASEISGCESVYGGGRFFDAVAKRVLDLFLAGLLLVVLVPVWAVIALAIRLDSTGPILFRQVRVGRGGQPFILFKFRSMGIHSDDSVHRQYVETFINHGTAADTVGGQPYFKLRTDPRITRVGQFLRRTSLDELPQLLNVIRGEMSLVGPRPALPYEVERYQPWQLNRLKVLPGITGFWQVYGRSRVTFDEMVRMDIDYAERRSFWLDVKLLLLTLPVVLSGTGAG